MRSLNYDKKINENLIPVATLVVLAGVPKPSLRKINILAIVDVGYDERFARPTHPNTLMLFPNVPTPCPDLSQSASPRPLWPTVGIKTRARLSRLGPQPG